MFRYQPRQVILHWTVVLLLVIQYLFNEPIGEAFDAWMEEGAQDPGAGTYLHVIVGSLVLLLAIWRLVLRGSSPAAPAEPGMLGKIGRLTHLALYALLVLVPLAGMTAWFGGIEAAGELHEVLTTLLLLVTALHVGAALYHQFILKDHLLRRMSLRD